MVLRDGCLTASARRAMERFQQASQAAERCAEVCIEEGDPEKARCIRLCQDVADLASTNARLVVRGSGSLPKLAQVCLDACLTAGDECARFEDEPLTDAEDALRRCAEACEEIASGGSVLERGDAMAREDPGGPWSGYF